MRSIRPNLFIRPTLRSVRAIGGKPTLLLHHVGHPRPIALALQAPDPQRAPSLLWKGRKRENIHAGLEFIWEMSADIS